MKAYVVDRPDFNFHKQISFLTDTQIYNFRTGQWEDKLRDAKPLNNDYMLLLSSEMYQALADNIHLDKSIDKPEENFNAGKLEATERHLEDMRKLVFEEDNK